MTLALASRRTALTPPWVRNDLWRRARSVPSLDLQFADTKSLVDSATGQSLVSFARASSGTYTNSAGVLQTAATDVPRFDHNPTTGESLGLLVEEQRTNLLLQSEDFSTTWSGAQLTVTTNAIAAPNAATTADALFETTATTEHRTRQFLTGLTANTNYTVSVFAKDLGGRNISIRILDTDNVANGYLATFSPSTGTVVVAATSIGSGVAASASVVPYANGWYRFILTGNAGATCTKYILDFFSASGTATSFAGDITKGLYLWGAQLEAGAFPTSYIPTTTAAVTRAADVASITGSNFSSWYRQDEGTVFVQTQLTSVVKPIFSRNALDISDGTTNERSRITASLATSELFDNLTMRSSATTQASFSTAGSAVNTAPRSIALAIKADNFAAAATGSISVVSDTSGAMPAGQTTLTIGRDIGATGYLNGTIKRLVYFPQRLSDSTLQAITQ